MGFSFNKATQSGGGGGGGKVHRQPANIVNNGNVNLAFPDTFYPATSPQFRVNYRHYAEPYPDFQSHYTGGNSTLTVSVPSTYWVDLIYATVTASGRFTQITINGESITNFPQPADDAVPFVADVYGYGVSATFYQTGYYGPGSNYNITAGPLNPRTEITESGSVLWPAGLTGYSVVRDI